MRTLSRRSLIGSAALGAAATWAVPRRSRAGSISAADRKFIFVQALGGWDITQIFAPVFGSEYVDVDAAATLGTWRDIQYVDNANRPSVPEFFTNWGDQTGFLNGIYIASIAHPSAARLLLSGSLDSSITDWATIIAAKANNNPVLPHLVVGGLYYAGNLGVHVGRAGSNGQLQGLASAELLQLSDAPVNIPTTAQSQMVDSWLASSVLRAKENAATLRRATKMDGHAQAGERAARVKTMTEELSFEGGSTFAEQVEVAITALSNSVSRVVTLSHPGRDDQVAWDSHAINEATQSALFESLFSDLDGLMTRLAESPTATGTLADETCVVVLSELARSPKLNGSNGRDHWPCTSAFLIGSGIGEGRMAGSYDDKMYGGPIDLATGALDDNGTWLGPEHLGATLMALADIDPAEENIPGEPVTALIK